MLNEGHKMESAFHVLFKLKWPLMLDGVTTKICSLTRVHGLLSTILSKQKTICDICHQWMLQLLETVPGLCADAHVCIFGKLWLYMDSLCWLLVKKKLCHAHCDWDNITHGSIFKAVDASFVLWNSSNSYFNFEFFEYYNK